MNRIDFSERFNAWLAQHQLSAPAAAELLGVTRLRVHMYKAAVFVYTPEREAIVLIRMELAQKGERSFHTRRPRVLR